MQFFTQYYKGCSANSMASWHPIPELTGEPQSRSHFVNVIFNFGNILLFMCCFCLLTQLSRLVHFLSVVYCSALIVQLSGLDSSHSSGFVRLSLGCTFPLLLCQATSWHPSGSQGSPSERRSNIRGVHVLLPTSHLISLLYLMFQRAHPSSMCSQGIKMNKVKYL